MSVVPLFVVHPSATATGVSFTQATVTVPVARFPLKLLVSLSLKLNTSVPQKFAAAVYNPPVVKVPLLGDVTIAYKLIVSPKSASLDPEVNIIVPVPSSLIDNV